MIEFRQWVVNKWYEHLDELDSLGIRNKNVGDYDMEKYFNKYKWWLKDLYRRDRVKTGIQPKKIAEKVYDQLMSNGDMGWTTVPKEFKEKENER